MLLFFFSPDIAMKGCGVKKNIFFLTVWLLFSALSSFAGERSAQQEIMHLLEYLETSDCTFNRNGTWYDGGEAVDHIKRKYRYLEKKNLVNSTESFIARAASKSSMSGKPYLVRCGSGEPVESGAWFDSALRRFRQQQP